MAEPDPLGCPSQRGLARNLGCLWTCPGMRDRPGGTSHKAGAGKTPLLPVGPVSADGLHCAGRGAPACYCGRLPSWLTGAGTSRGRAPRLRPAPQAVHTAPCPKPSSPDLCPGTGRPASPGALGRLSLRKPSHLQAPCQGQGWGLTIQTPWTSVPSVSSGTPPLFPSPRFPPRPWAFNRTHKPAEATR